MKENQPSTLVTLSVSVILTVLVLLCAACSIANRKDPQWAAAVFVTVGMVIAEASQRRRG